ncbi:MAG TPA: AraC family transcriptional regulator, partial [Pyrinomonadaceae bacterium]|nr:AraC family transcriptional regulator [Pyrinomonadaceae bacterium]
MIIRGAETHICRGMDYTATPGDLLLLNAEEAHANRSVLVEYKCIQVNPRSFTRLLPEVAENNRTLFFAEPVVRDPKMFRSFLNLYSMLERNDSHLEQQSKFASAIAMLLHTGDRSNVSVDPIESGSITRVRRYLREHYPENVSLSFLASIANLSPYHLVRVFNHQIGVPPHEYQTQ